jgi:UPF0755 protein
VSKLWRNVGLVVLGLAGGLAGGSYYFVTSGIKPEAAGSKFYVRYPQETKLSVVAKDLERRGVIRSASALGWYAWYKKKDRRIPTGTYQVWPGLTADELLDTLQKPVVNMFRLPETNLSYRTANLLEKNEIAKAAEYKELRDNPEEFKGTIKFPLPKDSLEGYLYPDTYDLPPLLGAKGVIERQLKAFQSKVAPLLTDPKKARKILTIASMVELEAGVDHERARIAGVIRNRLDKGMRLQIDATVLYALQEWRRLYNRDYHNTNSPYNTYKIKGLPPGPICSPSVKSVQAALKSEKHEWLYYVAMPNRTHLFAKTYEDHLKNIQVARKARTLSQTGKPPSKQAPPVSSSR